MSSRALPAPAARACPGPGGRVRPAADGRAGPFRFRKEPAPDRLGEEWNQSRMPPVLVRVQQALSRGRFRWNRMQFRCERAFIALIEEKTSLGLSHSI